MSSITAGVRWVIAQPLMHCVIGNRWPAAELMVIEDEGHRAGPAMDAAVTAAIARLTAT